MAKAKTTEEEITGLEVESADLQSAAMIPGISTFTTINQAKAPGIKMKWTQYGLHCWATNKAGKDREFLIPSANVKSMVLSK